MNTEHYLCLAFNEKREFVTEDILSSIQNMVPLAKTKNKELEALRAWADSGNIALASDK